MKTLKEDFYFKKIDIPNYCLIDEELKTFYKKTSLYGGVVILQTNILKYFPMLSDWFNTHSLSVDFIGCFILKGKCKMNPHIDFCAQRLALNFPLNNCENSKTIFYEYKGKKEVKKTKKTQKEYIVVDQDSCTKSEEFTFCLLYTSDAADE